MKSSLFECSQFSTIYFEDKTYTKQWLKEQIKIFGDHLTQNVKHNSPFIYLYATNNIKTIIALYAINKINKICVLLDPSIGPLELNEHRNELPPCAEIHYGKENEFLTFNDRTEIPVHHESLEDVSVIIYAYAEDGKSRPAMLTNKNILSNAKNIIELNLLEKSSISASIIPYCHLFGLQTGVIAPFLNGSPVFVSDMISTGNFKKVLKSLSEIKVTHFYSIPLVYYLLGKYGATSLESIRSFVSGGYKLCNSIYQSCLKKNICVHEGYGLSETSPICTWHTPNDIVKIDTVGKTFGNCKIKIDRSGFSTDSRVGEIIVSGDHVMKGYYGFSPIDSKIVDDWFYTGDIGFIDEDNYLVLTGMKKHMYNVFGKKIYKKEIERMLKLSGMAKTIDIKSEYNEMTGDSITATIQLEDNNESSKDIFTKWCKANLTSYKIPHKFNFT